MLGWVRRVRSEESEGPRGEGARWGEFFFKRVVRFKWICPDFWIDLFQCLIVLTCRCRLSVALPPAPRPSPPQPHCFCFCKHARTFGFECFEGQLMLRPRGGPEGPGPGLGPEAGGPRPGPGPPGTRGPARPPGDKGGWRGGKGLGMAAWPFTSGRCCRGSPASDTQKRSPPD